MYAEAERLAEETGGHYLDQFTNAERATDWRGNNNIAESIFDADGRGAASGSGLDRGRRGHRRHQRDHRPVHPLPPPRHPVVRRSIRRTPRSSRPMRKAAATSSTGVSSRIEGIGRPRVEPSFLPDVVDRMVVVPDAASVAAAHHVSRGAGPPGRAVDGHESVGCVRPAGRDGRRRAQRVGGDPARRQRRPLRRHLLLRRVADQPRARPLGVFWQARPRPPGRTC